MKLFLVAALVAAVMVPAAAAVGPTVLNGQDGPGFNITLTKGGKKVTTLTPGTYIFKIADRSNIHNFHQTGPGVDKKTDVSYTGQQSWTVRLRKGTYRYVCDPHKAFMKGSFTVS